MTAFQYFFFAFLRLALLLYSLVNFYWNITFIYIDRACKAMKTFPELPPVKRCHDYVINTKYTYRCTGCAYRYVLLVLFSSKSSFFLLVVLVLAAIRNLWTLKGNGVGTASGSSKCC